MNLYSVKFFKGNSIVFYTIFFNYLNIFKSFWFDKLQSCFKHTKLKNVLEL